MPVDLKRKRPRILRLLSASIARVGSAEMYEVM